MNHSQRNLKGAFSEALRGERGVLLISVAMIVIIAATIAAAASTRVVKDTRSSEQRRENVESFYAAQAGEQAMLAAIRQDAMSRFAAAQAAWPGNGAILTNPQNFFSAGEVTLPGVRLPTGACFDTVRANISFVNAQILNESQVNNFQYTITSQGTDPDNPDLLSTIISAGNFQIQTTRQSFANYSLFTGTHTMTSGTRVWFTTGTDFSGRVHTNSRFAFAYSPTFANGLVSSVAQDAYFYNNGRVRRRNADNNAPRDVPIFGAGFERGADEIALPENSFVQKESTIGGPASTNAEIRDTLGLAAGNTPPPNGIYIPNDGTSITAGIYVEGTVTDITTYVDAQNQQNIEIQHGNGDTANITIDTVNNQTTIDSVVYEGVPNGAIYVSGNVNSFGGPERWGGVAPPAIQSNTAMSLFAEGDVVITRDIVYQDDPLTSPDAKNVLGIFTPGGDIRIGQSAPDDVMIHSTLMTSDGQGVVQVDAYNSGSPRGTATIFGGVISSYYGAFGTFNSRGHASGFARNFVYDERLNGGIAPPYFPTTNTFGPAECTVNPVTWGAQKQRIPGNSANFNIPSSDPDFEPNFS